MRLERFTRHRPNDRTRMYNDNKNPNDDYHRVIFVATNIQTRIRSILGDVHRGRFDRVTANTTTPKSRRDQGTSRRQKPKTTKPPKKSPRRFETSSERKNLAPSVLERRRVRRVVKAYERRIETRRRLHSSHVLRGIGILLRSLLLQRTKVLLHLCVVLRVCLLSLFLFQNLLQFLFRYWKQKPIFTSIVVQRRSPRRKIRQENHRRQGN